MFADDWIVYYLNSLSLMGNFWWVVKLVAGLFVIGYILENSRMLFLRVTNADAYRRAIQEQQARKASGGQ